MLSDENKDDGGLVSCWIPWGSSGQRGESTGDKGVKGACVKGDVLPRQK